MNGNKGVVKFKLSFWFNVKWNFKQALNLWISREKKLALFYFTSTIHAILQENFKKFVLSAVIANFVNLRRGVCPSV